MKRIRVPVALLAALLCVGLTTAYAGLESIVDEPAYWDDYSDNDDDYDDYDNDGDEYGESGWEDDTPAPAGDASMPDWYPADPQSFLFFHDENAPRVVDGADLFTDAEEQRMERRIAELRSELQRDIVLFTDESTHGLGRDVYAADFYDFNGYGCGDEREGVCLFICMEPGNRGFRTCCTGPDTRALYTEDVANALDDALYDCLSEGRYAEGAADWIENIRTLYVKGVPFAPDWYPDRGAAFERFHDGSAPRVADQAGLLSAAEVAALGERAAAISRKYGVDVVLLTADEPMTSRQYAEAFYYYNGYGFGRNYDGILLGVFKTPEYSTPWCRVLGFGKGAERLSDVNEKRLSERCDEALESGAYYEAMNGWLNGMEHMLKTGRVPRSAASWGGTAALGAVLGTLFGGISLGGAKRKMRAPRIQRGADAYLAPDGLRVVPLRDDYTGTTTARTYSPPPRESSSGGGSSSGHSSYSSSYSGSSGAGHSGSGRSF